MRKPRVPGEPLVGALDEGLRERHGVVGDTAELEAIGEAKEVDHAPPDAVLVVLG